MYYTTHVIYIPEYTSIYILESDSCLVELYLHCTMIKSNLVPYIK